MRAAESSGVGRQARVATVGDPQPGPPSEVASPCPLPCLAGRLAVRPAGQAGGRRRPAPIDHISRPRPATAARPANFAAADSLLQQSSRPLNSSQRRQLHRTDLPPISCPSFIGCYYPSPLPKRQGTYVPRYCHSRLRAVDSPER